MIDISTVTGQFLMSVFAHIFEEFVAFSLTQKEGKSMYDTLDLKKAKLLEDVDTTATDSIYAHKDSQTINNNMSWVYVKAPVFIEPVIIHSPRISFVE